MPKRRLSDPLVWSDPYAIAVVSQADIEEAKVWWQKYAAGLGLILLGGGLIEIGRRRRLREMSVAIRGNKLDGRALCDNLRSGDVSLADWQMQMARNIKVSHIAAAAIAAGGIGQITPAMVARIEENVAFQLSYLSQLASSIAGGQVSGGTMCRLAQLYLGSSRGTYNDIDGIMMGDQGFDLYRNVLGAGEEHCDGGNSCPEVSDMGWQPIGSLPQIGSRKCLGNCLCSWEYMNSFTGERA